MEQTRSSKGLKHRTMAAAILEEVRKRILDGTYPAGAQLRQDMIADEFGTSRIPVREALFQLEAEGLAKIAPHKGATVTGFSATDAAEAFELRALLEPRLLAASIPNLSATDFVEIDGILRDYRTALDQGQTAIWGQLNTTLHLTLYRRADQPRTEAIVAGLLQECDRYTRLHLSADRGELERADHEHHHLVALCRTAQRQPAQIEPAARFLRSHIAHVAEALNQFLGQH